MTRTAKTLHFLQICLNPTAPEDEFFFHILCRRKHFHHQSDVVFTLPVHVFNFIHDHDVFLLFSVIYVAVAL